MKAKFNKESRVDIDRINHAMEGGGLNETIMANLAKALQATFEAEEEEGGEAAGGADEEAAAQQDQGLGQDQDQGGSREAGGQRDQDAREGVGGGSGGGGEEEDVDIRGAMVDGDAVDDEYYVYS